MSQTWNNITTATTHGDTPADLMDNFNALLTQFSGVSAPSSPSTYQLWLDISGATPRLKIFSGSAWVDVTSYMYVFQALYAEVAAGRGSASDLAARLSVAINDDGTLKGDAPASAWWTTEADAVAYVDGATFTVGGDKTAIYLAGRAVKLTQTSNDSGWVAAASYSAGTGLTAVTVVGAAVDSGLSAVQYGQEPGNSPGILALPEQAAAPPTVAGEGALYTEDSGVQPELTFRSESEATEVRITQGDEIILAAQLDKSVAGSSDVTLSAVESQYGILNCTGALSGNINLIVPAKKRSWLVRNNTSGSYTLKIKTSAGGACLVVQGQSVHVLCDGSDCWNLDNLRGVFRNVQIVSSTTGWTAPDGIKHVDSELEAGGGGGGGSDTGRYPGGGGGGGGKSRKFVTLASRGETVTVTIPSASTGGANANGSTGGTVSFGSYHSATGGAGGTKGDLSNPGTGGVGGSGSGGDENLTGGSGRNGWSATTTNAPGGDGGGAPGTPASPSAWGVSSNGLAPGGGGQGAYASQTSAAGSGAVGRCVLRW